jgi:GH24 family phage-related lysozyme (muramidase)
MAEPVPQQAITLIQQFEGCHRTSSADDLIHAYPDPLSGGAPWTIGWGSTRYPDGRLVGPNDAISREVADSIFVANLQAGYWQPLVGRIPHWGAMNAEMRSALCSFAYNLGGDFYGSGGFTTISACLAERRWRDLPAALLLYVNPGSAVEVGLRRRRQAEADLWMAGLSLLDAAATPPAGQQLYEAISDTFLKKENVDSSQLPPHLLVPVEAGRQYKVEAVLTTVGGSRQVRLAYGAGDWWLYQPHWSVRELPAAPPAAAVAPPPPPPAAPGGGRLLDVPSFSQLDNRCNPMGSCNVTCVAMALAYLGMPYSSGSQLEDTLYRAMESLGWDRHDPNHLKALVETFPGYKDIFRTNGRFQDIRTALDMGRPVIIHGYFTASGHIIVIRGYDANGLIVNDPYGEYFQSGYDNSRSGAGLHYSYGLIARTCSPESQQDPQNLWIHSLFRV